MIITTQTLHNYLNRATKGPNCMGGPREEGVDGSLSLLCQRCLTGMNAGFACMCGKRNSAGGISTAVWLVLVLERRGKEQ